MTGYVTDGVGLLVHVRLKVIGRVSTSSFDLEKTRWLVRGEEAASSTSTASSIDTIVVVVVVSGYDTF